MIKPLVETDHERGYWIWTDDAGERYIFPFIESQFEDAAYDQRRGEQHVADWLSRGRPWT